MRKRFESTWAVRPEAVVAIVRLMSREMARDEAAMPGDLAADPGALFSAQFGVAGTPRTIGTGKVAVIPIQGVLTNDGPAYFGSNYKAIGDAAEKAAADPDIKRIILHVDSPGGEVTGLPETAALLARVAKEKPMSSIVGSAAASAAYWLASQAGDITLTPSGEVGSVGVRMMHVDMSKMLDAEGYKVTELHSGLHKTDWSPYKPLTGDAKADMQSRLDKSHREFMAAVSSGRGNRLSAAIRQAKMGGGRMLSASDALKHGMVDSLQSVREFYRRGPVPESTRHARAELEQIKARAYTR